MGDRIKPNWGLEAGEGEMIPAPSNELRNSVISIFQLKDKELEQFLDGLIKIISTYRYEKEYRNIGTGLTQQTKGKVKQAALDIKKQTQILSKMLYGDAGGLQPYLDYSVSVPLRSNGNMISLTEFTRLLEGVENGCDHYLNDIYPKLAKAPRLKELMARDVMTYYRDFLDEEPTATLSVNSISKFAMLLNACFLEVDNFSPSEGDLKGIMSWAKNNS